MAGEKKIQIVLRRSLSGRSPKQRKTAHALGLRRIGQSVELTATASVVGMVATVSHMVEVKETS